MRRLLLLIAALAVISTAIPAYAASFNERFGTWEEAPATFDQQKDASKTYKELYVEENLRAHLENREPPIQYLRYDLPYYKLALKSSPAYRYSRPKHAAAGRYSGLYDFGAAPIPYIGYSLTPYYNLAPGCPLGNPPGHTPPIC